MTHQPKHRSGLLLGLAMVVEAVTLCLVLPMVVTTGDPVWWVLLAVGLVAAVVTSARAVWRVLDEDVATPTPGARASTTRATTTRTSTTRATTTRRRHAPRTRRPRVRMRAGSVT